MVFAHASWLVPMVEAFLDQEVARAVSFAGP
jgi:hypothetical protein